MPEPLAFPPEIWLQVFRLVTTPQEADLETHYVPFRAIPMQERPIHYQPALNARRTLVLVCKEWRQWVNDHMYHMIRIEGGSKSLREALGVPPPGELAPYASGPNRRESVNDLVKIVEISTAFYDFDPFNPLGVAEIVQACPKAEVLIRPYAGFSRNHVFCRPRYPVPHHSDPNPQRFPQLASVRRLDWWPATSGPYTSHPSNRHGGGGGYLADLLPNLPNLEYLTAGFSEHTSFMGRGFDTVITVRPVSSTPPESGPQSGADLTWLRLKTFRVEVEPPHESLRANEALPTVKWKVPVLKNLIVIGSIKMVCRVLGSIETVGGTPSPQPASSSSIPTVGRQIRVVELLRIPQNEVATAIPDILRQCPNVEELNIRLDQGPVEFATSSGSSTGELIRKHFANNTQYPSLRILRLYRDPKQHRLEDELSRAVLTLSLLKIFRDQGMFPRLGQLDFEGDWSVPSEVSSAFKDALGKCRDAHWDVNISTLKWD
ncbi:hypothetical protein BDN72DRAFT_837861 [Pluteus cervinus]|uniref:Uncharacterized protein n=1 Tax=Pluteus cervinus TaxID=181527 RepID=A0ACD3B0H0_9AGAR|nr:hypothetical protein BDN72DRAFT_837861 [Pluteus cervinus]